MYLNIQVLGTYMPGIYIELSLELFQFFIDLLHSPLIYYRTLKSQKQQVTGRDAVRGNVLMLQQ